MTKRHFEAVAHILNNEAAFSLKAQPHLESVARRLADYFATDNSRFDRARFLKACGVEVVK